MSGFVYILQSEVNGRYYIGSTIDVNRRVEQHNKGECKYTKETRPFTLVLFQQFDDIKIARQIEYRLKRLKSRKIIEAILKDGFIKMDL